mmetsp:Transcript_11748/g.35813  ORF Transcript_11748/g.35813 Transcript_11748/m.35813 type:complete len:327 (-) Transcript_11748:244-1224(-)
MGNTVAACMSGMNAPESSAARQNMTQNLMNAAMKDFKQKGGPLNFANLTAGSGTKWQNTNIGGVGGDRDKQLRKTAAETETEFQGAGQQLGIEIWRVEKFKPKRQPLQGFPGFYDGDSYIVLHTYQLPGEAKYRWDLFFWLGKESTQDEKGSAAYFTVNIDDMLDTFPVQHREVQGSESPEFKALFNGSIPVLSGGIGSGFQEGGVAFNANPALTTYSGDSNDIIGKELPKKLFHVSDQSGAVDIQLVEEGKVVSKSNLSEHDPCILVVGTEAAYVYVGSGCSAQEKLYVTDAAGQLLQSVGIDQNIPVSFIKQGMEPPQWKAYVV